MQSTEKDTKEAEDIYAQVNFSPDTADTKFARIRLIATALAAARAEGRKDEETGWVIEHGESEVSSPKYFGGLIRAVINNPITPFVCFWTKDNSLVVRFSRKRDAECIAITLKENSYLDQAEIYHRVCEHAWDIRALIDKVPEPLLTDEN